MKKNSTLPPRDAAAIRAFRSLPGRDRALVRDLIDMLITEPARKGQRGAQKGGAR